MYFRALSKMVAQKSADWDEYLNAVTFGLRTKKLITTQFSPFFLMFGREAQYPTEVPEHYKVGKCMSQYDSEFINVVLESCFE